MPTYEYEREDGTRFELEQRISENALETCPTTGQKVKRLISATSFQLKGSGWYKTDYSKAGSSSSSTSKSSTTSTSSTDSAPKPAETAAKPAAKAE